MAENQPNEVWPRAGAEPAFAADHRDFDQPAGMDPRRVPGVQPGGQLSGQSGGQSSIQPGGQRRAARPGFHVRFARGQQQPSPCAIAAEAPSCAQPSPTGPPSAAKANFASPARISPGMNLPYKDFSESPGGWENPRAPARPGDLALRRAAAALALAGSENSTGESLEEFDEDEFSHESKKLESPGSPHALPVRAARPRRSLHLGERLIHMAGWLKTLAIRHAVFILLLAAFEAVVAPGLFLRVLPMYGDEVDLAHRYVPIQANKIASIFSVSTTHFGMHNLDFAARALALQASSWAAKNRDIAMRLINYLIAAGLLTAVYAFGTAFWSRWMGLAMAFTAAFSHYNLFLTINGYYCNETALAILAGAFFLIGGLYSTKRRLAALAIAASSFFAALSYMLYFTGRVACAAYLLIWGLEFTQRKDFWRAHGWKMALWAVCLGLLLWMPVKSVNAKPEKGDARKSQVSLLNRQNMTNFLNVTKLESVDQAIMLNVKLAFRAFYYGPNSYHAYRTPYPYVDRFSGVLLILGVLLALWKWRDLRYGALLALWVAYNAIPAGLTTLDSPPYHPRAHAGILFGWMLVALPLGWALEKAAQWRAGARKPKMGELDQNTNTMTAMENPPAPASALRIASSAAVEFACAAILLSLAVYNTRIYYQKFHFNFKTPSVAEWRLYDEIARYYQRSGPTTAFIMANTNATLLTWTNQVTTQNRSPGVHWDFDGLTRNGMMKFINPNRVVVVQALAERVPEVRAVLKKSNYKWREIRETIPELRVDYTFFVLGKY